MIQLKVVRDCRATITTQITFDGTIEEFEALYKKHGRFHRIPGVERGLEKTDIEDTNYTGIFDTDGNTVIEE